MASAVTGLYPWLGYKLNERVSVWGVTGYGAGGLLLTPQGGPALESGLSMKMSAAGTRGELVPGGDDGFGLAFKADALWVGTATDGVDGPAGRMAATEAAVSRVRTALEGSRGFRFGRGLSLKPSVEVGVRHDAGDAEQGSGMDVGGGLVVSDAATGLAVDMRVRMLLVHEAEDFRERGVSVSLSYNPTPSDAAGADGQGGAVVGRAGAERRRGPVGPGHDGRDGARRLRLGQPARRRGRLRAAGRQPVRRDAAGRLHDLRVRTGLPGGLRPHTDGERQADVAARRRCAAPGESDAGRHEQRAARARQRGLVRSPDHRMRREGASGTGELPSVALTTKFLALCQQYGSERLAVSIVAAGRSAGVPRLPESDDWTAWNADEMRAAVEYLQRKRGG